MVLAMRSDTLRMPRWIVPIQDEETRQPTFGETLRALREERGWSQEEVAEAVGIRQGKISSYELDKVKDPPVLNVIALEDLYGLERGTLFGILWGERARDEIRRMFARSRVFAIREDSPPALYDAIEEIGTLEDDQIEETRRWIRERWQARKAVRSKHPTPIRTTPAAHLDADAARLLADQEAEAAAAEREERSDSKTGSERTGA